MSAHSEKDRGIIFRQIIPLSVEQWTLHNLNKRHISDIAKFVSQPLNFRNGGRELQLRIFSCHQLGSECRWIVQMQVIHVFALSTTMYTAIK